MAVVTVSIKGTSFVTTTELDGKYLFSNIPAGNYIVDFTFIGYKTIEYTGIKISEHESKTLNVKMVATTMTIGDGITVYGDKPLVDVEDAGSKGNVGKQIIEAIPDRNVQGILNTQTGIVQSPEGIHIRGGRTYETGFLIDDVSAGDPLAGTGFGLDVGSNSIDNIDISTSSSDVANGNSTAGTVNTKTRNGSEKFALNLSAKKDNLGFDKNWNSVFNTSSFEVGMGGPIRVGWLATDHKFSKFHYFTSFKTFFSDTYIKNPANQIVSSLYPAKTWTPFEDNRWSGMLKLNYDVNKTSQLSLTYLKSIIVNQDINMLRITGNDVGFQPGFQFAFSLEPDNANTYTHDSNLEILKWTQTPKPNWNYTFTYSRLYVHLRADANGREWRPKEVNTEFDPASITTFPTTYFNPADSIIFTTPAPGLYNNNGIATLWHDHYVVENTGRLNFLFFSKNTLNKLNVGTELKKQEMQWIDIVRPWIGAPIQLANGDYTQSFRLGDLSDVWQTIPITGAVYLADKFKYRGLIADFGFRFEYWSAGKFVDDAVNNPSSPIADEIRKSYLQHTTEFLGRRWKMRLLPKIAASFPIKENQVMYFNYGHSTVAPHPSYIYTGLDPFYADRSTLSRLGNPDLNPEVDISYELGLKSQIGNNDALNITAFWKDKYDFITSSTILLKDVTGHEVSRTIHINSDYARVRGVEITYIKRIKKWFEGQISLSLSAATGQSSSASQSLADILQTGNSVSTKELPLAWDSPIDAKAFCLFTKNSKTGFFDKKYLNHFNFYFESILRSGKRYTPYIFSGNEPTSGRPIYEIDSDPNHANSKISSPSFLLNATFKKSFILKKINFALTVELTNVLNTKNTAIVNPVTGKAYRYGDPVPTEWRDPVYLDPRDYRSSLLPPTNPSRFDEQRHVLFGVSFKI